MPPIEVLLPYINTTGVIGTLVLIIWALVTGKVATRGELDRMVEQLDHMRTVLESVIARLAEKGDR